MADGGYTESRERNGTLSLEASGGYTESRERNGTLSFSWRCATWWYRGRRQTLPTAKGSYITFSFDKKPTYYVPSPMPQPGSKITRFTWIGAVRTQAHNDKTQSRAAAIDDMRLHRVKGQGMDTEHTPKPSVIRTMLSTQSHQKVIGPSLLQLFLLSLWCGNSPESRARDNALEENFERFASGLHSLVGVVPFHHDFCKYRLYNLPTKVFTSIGIVAWTGISFLVTEVNGAPDSGSQPSVAGLVGTAMSHQGEPIVEPKLRLIRGRDVNPLIRVKLTPARATFIQHGAVGLVIVTGTADQMVISAQIILQILTLVIG
ncbi:hypothetical protein BD779DRAFT_1469958 [Infundibulicybe gibba]|nr:hypothetical protein BD779DRAFT_1469958 [Infundibulicybe gibba]